MVVVIAVVVEVVAVAVVVVVVAVVLIVAVVVVVIVAVVVGVVVVVAVVVVVVVVVIVVVVVVVGHTNFCMSGRWLALASHEKSLAGPEFWFLMMWPVLLYSSPKSAYKARTRHDIIGQDNAK